MGSFLQGKTHRRVDCGGAWVPLGGNLRSHGDRNWHDRVHRFHTAELSAISGDSCCAAAVASKSIVNVGDVREDARWLETFGSTRAEIIVPVPDDGGRVTGLVDVDSDRVNAFGAGDEQFLLRCATEIHCLF